MTPPKQHSVAKQVIKPTSNHRLFTLFTGTFLCVGLLFSQLSWAASNDDLKGVKEQISRQSSSISSQQKQLNSLQGDLKDQEVSISKINQEIHRTEKQLNIVETNLDQLQTQKQQLEQQQQQQTETLQSLVKSYYVLQGNSKPPQIFQDDKAADNDRISQYLQHLATARTEAIAALQQTKSQLVEKEQQLAEQKQTQSDLLAKQTKRRNELSQNRAQRQQTLSKIRTSIRSEQTKLQELLRNETRLKAEIAKAAKRNATPMDGLGRQQGKLPWPIEGSVLHNYGSHQSGQISWKGMVFKARNEEPVKAVYSGKVVFAEWLRGYGLVILIDHGKGDMTLYGYNDTLLKKEGDKVGAGEVIALAGDTGGQDQPALYFEIRRNSKPQNPKHWLH